MKKSEKAKVDKVVDAMKRLMTERAKIVSNLDVIDMAIKNLLQKNVHDDDDNTIANALLNLKPCNKFGAKHKVKISTTTEESWHNGDIDTYFCLACDKCPKDGRGCSRYEIMSGHKVQHTVKNWVVLDWLFDDKIDL